MEDDVKSPLIYHLILISTKDHNQTIILNQTLGNMGRKLLLVSASLAISLPGQQLTVHHSSHHSLYLHISLPSTIHYIFDAPNDDFYRTRVSGPIIGNACH